MISFLEYLLEEIELKKQRKKWTKASKDDVEYLRKNYPLYNKLQAALTIRDIKRNIEKHLNADGIKLDRNVDDISLNDLNQIVKQNNVDLHRWLGKRKNDWSKHENDVIDGLNFLFLNNFFKNISNGKAESSGKNIKQADVHVKANNADFFIECKLDFYSAEYFKYGVKIINDRIIYNHKKYTDGLDEVLDKQQIEKIDDLFNNEINITQFLNEIVNSALLKTAWKEFLDNAHNVEDFMKNSTEYRDFCKDKFTNVWPDDFNTFIKTFDTYCDFYIEKYNTLIDSAFKLFDSRTLNKEYFKIISHDANDKDSTFLKLAILKKEIEENDLQIYNREKLYKIFSLISKIENKFNKLLWHLGKSELQMNQIKSFKKSEKTKYFFKMFLSSSAKRTKTNPDKILAEDQLGNMEICSVRDFESEKLALLITNFYHKKDNCLYIQIDNILFQFDKDTNQLLIEKLPLFKDVLKKYNIKLSVSDDMSSVRLHITAIKPKEQDFNTFNLVSLKKKDTNFIGNH